VGYVYSSVDLLNDSRGEIVGEISKQHGDKLQTRIVHPSRGWPVTVVVVPIDGGPRLYPYEVIVGVFTVWNVDQTAFGRRCWAGGRGCRACC
jgi:hypothetical protein